MPGAGGAAQGFASADGDQVSSGGDQPAEPVRGREFFGGVDENREARPVRDSADLVERQTEMFGVGLKQDAGGARTDGGLQLPRIGADTLPRVPELDEPAAGRAHGMVIRGAVRSMNDELVRTPGSVRQCVHPRQLVAGQDRARPQVERRGSARRDAARLSARESNDRFAGSRLELMDRYEALRRLDHRAYDRLAVPRPAQARRTADRVDHEVAAPGCR